MQITNKALDTELASLTKAPGALSRECPRIELLSAGSSGGEGLEECLPGGVSADRAPFLPSGGVRGTHF